MAREIERAGIPVAQVCTMVNVALSAGANRIVPSASVLCPTGNPALDPGAERALRRRLMERALAAVRARLDAPLVTVGE